MPRPNPFKLGSLLLVVLPWGAACGDAPLSPREPSAGAPHFTVMSYNIELGSTDDSATLEAIGAAGADVVGLQEVTSEAELAIVEEYLDEYPYQLYQSRGGAGGLAVLSRFPLTDRGLHEGPGGWHPAWHVDAATPAGTVQVLNVHLRSVFSGDGGPVRSYFQAGGDHVAEIDDFSAQCDASLSNVVLGDFNEGVDGDAVRFLERQGFDNALPEFHPGQPTWRYRSVGDQLQATVDHVLFDDSLTVLNAWVRREGHSDHLPVLAHFQPTQW